MYIAQLSQEKQDFIKGRLQAFLQAEGLEGTELAEAIEDGLNSKVDDLGEILSYKERQNLKGDEEMDIRKEALERYFEALGIEAEAIENGENLYEIDGGEYLVLLNHEAKLKIREDIEQSVWAFNSYFLADYTELPEIIFETLQPLCEGSNDAILKLIESNGSIADFTSEAIEADGEGHFLATYDHEEIELDGGLYAYRIN